MFLHYDLTFQGFDSYRLSMNMSFCQSFYSHFQYHLYLIVISIVSNTKVVSVYNGIAVTRVYMV